MKRLYIVLVAAVAAGCATPSVPLGQYRDGTAVLRLHDSGRASYRKGFVKADGPFAALSTNEVSMRAEVSEAKLTLIGSERKTEWVPRSEEHWYFRLYPGEKTFRRFQDEKAMRTQATREEIARGNIVTVEGFVKRPGSYSHQEGMTVADALALAGGHAHCSHCETLFPDMSHPTYSGPIALKRDGREQKVPKSDWASFRLRPGDSMKVRHIWL